MIIAAVIVVFILFIVLIYRWYRKDIQKRFDNLLKNLDEPVKLRFVKVRDYHNQFEVEFFNPVSQFWWTLPSHESAYYRKWSFIDKGFYGHVGLYRMKCSGNDIELVKKKYKTYRDIQDYFDLLNNKNNEWAEKERKHRDTPDIIY